MGIAGNGQWIELPGRVNSNPITDLDEGAVRVELGKSSELLNHGLEYRPEFDLFAGLEPVPIVERYSN